MIIDKLTKIYFSPTHSTEKVINAIARGWGVNEQKRIKLNSLEQRHRFKLNIDPSEAVILGIPVYEERIPHILYPALKKIVGNGQPMVLVVTYGNICAGITLKQLNKLMTRQGFVIIAAAAFIGEHAFSHREIKIASGRPDKRDLEKAEHLGRQIHQKILSIEKLKNVSELNIKGELRAMGRFLPRHSEMLFTNAPVLNSSSCQQCGKCLEVCPVNAIDTDNFRSREKLCIRCFACVKICPHDARKISYKKPVLVKTVLKTLGKKRQEPEIYI